MQEFYKNADIRNSWLFILLCIMVFAAGIFKVDSTYINSLAIFDYEALFIFLYVISLKSNARSARFIRNHKYTTVLLLVFYLVLNNDYFFNFVRTNYGLDFILILTYAILVKSGQPFVRLITHYRLTAVLLIFWLLTITISFYWSPIDVSEKPFARVRFWQTIMHVLFFIVLFDFLKKNRPPIIYLLMPIPISAVLIGFGFLVIYLNTASGEIGDYQWFTNPPFQSHIRTVGFQITAGIAVLLPYLLNWRSFSPLLIFQYLMAILLWAFLFWCGARAPIVSLLIVALFLWFLVRVNRLNSRNYVIATVVSVFAAVLLSSWISVFSWNGVFQSVTRSINAVSLNETKYVAGAEMNSHERADTISIDWLQLTSERTRLWKASLNAVKKNMVFGLGSQSFYFIKFHPRKGRVQPHNLFLQFLIEWGILGSLIFLLLLTMAFVSGAKKHLIEAKKNLQPDILAAGCIIVSLTLQGLLDGTYYHPQPLLYLAIGFAVWLLPPATSSATISEENTAVIDTTVSESMKQVQNKG